MRISHLCVTACFVNRLILVLEFDFSIGILYYRGSINSHKLSGYASWMEDATISRFLPTVNNTQQWGNEHLVQLGDTELAVSAFKLSRAGWGAVSKHLFLQNETDCWLHKQGCCRWINKECEISGSDGGDDDDIVLPVAEGTKNDISVFRAGEICFCKTFVSTGGSTWRHNLEQRR